MASNPELAAACGRLERDCYNATRDDSPIVAALLADIRLLLAAVRAEPAEPQPGDPAEAAADAIEDMEILRASREHRVSMGDKIEAIRAAYAPHMRLLADAMTRIACLETMCACYRVGRRPPEKILDQLAELSDIKERYAALTNAGGKGEGR